MHPISFHRRVVPIGGKIGIGLSGMPLMESNITIRPKPNGADLSWSAGFDSLFYLTDFAGIHFEAGFMSLKGKIIYGYCDESQYPYHTITYNIFYLNPNAAIDLGGFIIYGGMYFGLKMSDAIPLAEGELYDIELTDDTKSSHYAYATGFMITYTTGTMKYLLSIDFKMGLSEIYPGIQDNIIVLHIGIGVLFGL